MPAETGRDDISLMKTIIKLLEKAIEIAKSKGPPSP